LYVLCVLGERVCGVGGTTDVDTGGTGVEFWGLCGGGGSGGVVGEEDCLGGERSWGVDDYGVGAGGGDGDCGEEGLGPGTGGEDDGGGGEGVRVGVVW